MSPSAERAIRAVEVGIIATEGLMTVDGTPFTSYIEAELARHNLATRAVAEASLLRRYIRLEPPCAWCGFAIKPNQESREIDGRLLHDTDELRCAQEFDEDLDDYTKEYVANHPEVAARA
jgi:hypothetical protein